MFLIYCGNDVIHDPRFNDARMCFNPVLIKKVNAPGSLEFDMSIHNLHVADVTIGKRIRVVKDRRPNCIWEGSVQKRKRNFDGTFHITCIGRLAEMADVPIGRAVFNSEVVSGLGSFPGAIDKLFAYANTILPNNQKFLLGSCAFEWQKSPDGVDYTNEPTNWERDDCPTLWEALTTNQESRVQGDAAGVYSAPTAPLAAPYYGIIMPQYSFSDALTVDIIREADLLDDENVVKFGRNLLDLSQLWDASDAYNGILMTYEKRDSVDGEYHIYYYNYVTQTATMWCNAADLDNCILWDDDAIARMGGKKVVKRVNFGRDIEDPTTIYWMAIDELLNAAQMKYEINVSAVDMALINDEYDLFDVGKYYSIYDDHQGLSVAYMLNEMEMHLLSPEQNRYTFGSRTTETLTAAIANGTIGSSKTAATQTTGWSESYNLGSARNLSASYRVNISARLVEITVDGSISSGNLSGASPVYFGQLMPTSYVPDGNVLFSLAASNGNNHFLRCGMLPGNDRRLFLYSSSTINVVSEYITTKFVYGYTEGS